MKVGVIVNPVAGGGRVRREWPAIEVALKKQLGRFEVAETQGPGGTSKLAQRMVGDGAELLVAVGGDGTISEVVDGLLNVRGDQAYEVGVGIVPVGTGSDMARGMRIGGGYDAIAAGIAERPGRRIDAGRVEFRDRAGNAASRNFVNISSLGISGDIAAAANASKRRLAVSGKVLFLWHTLRELARYSPSELRVSLDSDLVFEGSAALIAVCNGRYFGGGMMIAPDAEIDDGLFDVVIVQGASKLALINALRRVYGGTHRTLGLCNFHQGSEVLVEPLGGQGTRPLGMEADGEAPGFGPARYRVLPRAITLRW